MSNFPTSQGELIRFARGGRTQVEFARLMECDRSCLSRYESEALGAPTGVLNKCLRIVAAAMDSSNQVHQPFERALAYAREVVVELERLQRGASDLAAGRRK